MLRWSASHISPWIRWSLLPLAAGLVSCGGGGASPADSGSDKTYLSVQVVDPEADALTYEWRVTAGSVENRNSPQTVWTMPPGPGLHFAYLIVSDGKGGQVSHQYAVPTDRIDNPAPSLAPVSHTPPAVGAGDEVNGSTARLRFYLSGTTEFASGSGQAARRVYLPDVRIRVVDTTDSSVLYTGQTSLGGEVALPPLVTGRSYQLSCTNAQGVAYSGCNNLTGTAESLNRDLAITPPGASNLRVFGHVGLSDGGVCGGSDEFFGLQRTATVQLQLADGTPASAVGRVNRFGDYALDASVAQQANLRLQVQCGSYTGHVAIQRPSGGYVANTQIEQSHTVPNRRPQIVRMVANGPEGNLRGIEVLPEANAHSSTQPGSTQFLTHKGFDTRLSACKYYKSFGAVADCDAQGNMVNPISLDDWKRQHALSPYNQGNTEVSATYINRRDLNLVRKMVATQSAPNKIAFVVCNHPGPETDNPREIDAVVDTAMANEKLVACVAMEHSPTPGRSGGQAFTKFLTFGPGGRLIASVNLDGRGEKFMPGACVACHGGASYMGRFPELGNPSPDLKSSFLAFDTGNYAFSSRPGLTEVAQSVAIRQLNDLVMATNPAPATASLIQGWYANHPSVLDKEYVPAAWKDHEDLANGITKADSAYFYKHVVGTSCRTCHAAMRTQFDWDASGGSRPQLLNFKDSPHLCGGGADPYANGSMPNALASVDRLQQTLRSDAVLKALMQKMLGCSESAGDPVYPKR